MELSDTKSESSADSEDFEPTNNQATFNHNQFISHSLDVLPKPKSKKEFSKDFIQNSGDFDFEDMFHHGGVGGRNDYAEEEDVEREFIREENNEQNNENNVGVTQKSVPSSNNEKEKKSKNGEIENGNGNDINNNQHHLDPEIGDEGSLIPELTAERQKYVVDDFKFLKMVGKGGYGKVYQVSEKDDPNAIYALKVLRKDFLIKTKNVEYTKMEKDILRKVRHPFIVSLKAAFQNDHRVYLLMDFINGGHLLFHMKQQAMFSEDVAKFYAAETTLALEHLHSLDIIHVCKNF